VTNLKLRRNVMVPYARLRDFQWNANNPSSLIDLHFDE